MYKIFYFLNQKWFFDKLLTQSLGKYFLKGAYNIGIKSLDKGF